MSACQVSRYTQHAPLRRPPWFTAATELSSVFSHGTMPFEWPFVPRISEPLARTRVYDSPMPPAYFESFATSE